MNIKNWREVGNHIIGLPAKRDRIGGLRRLLAQYLFPGFKHVSITKFLFWQRQVYSSRGTSIGKNRRESGIHRTDME